MFFCFLLYFPDNFFLIFFPLSVCFILSTLAWCRIQWVKNVFSVYLFYFSSPPFFLQPLHSFFPDLIFCMSPSSLIFPRSPTFFSFSKWSSCFSTSLWSSHFFPAWFHYFVHNLQNMSSQHLPSSKILETVCFI